MKHILVVSQYYSPEPMRVTDLCEKLVSEGHKVTVITGIPNYPIGKFYKGYGWFSKRRETVNGVEIIRLPIISRGNNKIQLVLNYYSFVVSGFFWAKFTKIKADTILCSAVSPMTQALPAMHFAKRRKIPFSFYVQDLWPETVSVITGIKGGIIMKSLDKMMNRIYRNCTHILTTSPGLKKRIEERESARGKVIYWPQYAESFYKRIENPVIPEDFPKTIDFKLIFTGNIGYAQGLEILPKLVRSLKNRGKRISVIVLGDGRYKEAFVQDIEKAGVTDSFYLLGRKPATEVPAYLSLSDAAFISFSDDELFKLMIPAKLQSYLACGMPVLASAEGETERVIREAECGFSSPLGDVEGLADCVEKMMELSETEMGRFRFNAERYSKDIFDRDKLIQELNKFLDI